MAEKPYKDPFRAALRDAVQKIGGDMPELEEKQPRRYKTISPKLATLAAELDHEADEELARVVAHSWSVEVQRYDDTPEETRDKETGELLAQGCVGYVPAFVPRAVAQCRPDVLSAMREEGVEGPVKIIFRSRTSADTFELETVISPEPVAEPRAISPNAGMPEMMAMFMAQQERQAQMLLAAVAKMTEKTAATDRDWQRKLEEANQRHAQQMQEMLNRQSAQFQGDKRLQIGGTIEQTFLQATNEAVARAFSNMLNPQPAPQAQQGMPSMGMGTTPTQMMAQWLQGMKADAEAKRVIAQELPGLVGEAAKAPEPTLFEYAQQLIPMFMLLKNMNGKDPNQLENAMKQFAMMRQGPAANVNPITGMPIPDAAPADGEAALAQLTANLG